jgi:hypothetical protein
MIAAEVRAEALQLLDIAAGNREPGSLPCERFRDRAAEAAGRAGDESGHSSEVKHHWLQ